MTSMRAFGKKKCALYGINAAQGLAYEMSHTSDVKNLVLKHSFLYSPYIMYVFLSCWF